MSDLLKINVSEHTDKKNGLTYLSWAWAWAEVLKLDPQATWEAVEFDGFPASFAPDGSAMVKTVVTIKGHSKSCWLPVMDYKNKAIKNPDAFAINTAMVRCMTKCISMHGLGLYIYAGEDLPQSENVVSLPKSSAMDGIGDDLPKEEREWLEEIAGYLTSLVKAGNVQEARESLDSYNLEGDQHIYLDRQLDSSVRNKIRNFKTEKVAA